MAGFVHLGAAKNDPIWNLYREEDAMRTPKMDKPKPNPKPPVDWAKRAARYAKAFGDKERAALAADLRLPTTAFDLLPRVGVSDRSAGDTTFTFPEADGDGTIIGLATRRGHEKKSEYGSGRGLSVPTNWLTTAGPVFIVEGASCTLAAAHAGLGVIGRPSDRGGVGHLVTLLTKNEAALIDAETGLPRPLVVVGENDLKNSGDWPGLNGAVYVAKALHKAVGDRFAVTYALPPVGFKDCRAWLTADARAETAWPDRGAELRGHLIGAAKTINAAPAKAEKEKPAKPPAVADMLIAIGKRFALWHGRDGSGFATRGRTTCPVRSQAFKSLLTKAYWDSFEKAPNADAMANAQNVLQAVAEHDGPEAVPHIRVAEHDGKIYHHLADAADTVVEIDAEGWRECDEPPVRFVRKAGMLPLPLAVRGGHADEVRDFLNVSDDTSWRLVRGWLTVAFRESKPHPLLILVGEQGSCKSSTARLLKGLIDPSEDDALTEPKDVGDLMVAATTSWVLSLDNVGTIAPWFSDALCRLSTGGSMSKRMLFTDSDKVILSARRPVILNGIDDFVTRSDLLERSLIIRHRPLAPGQRKTEAELEAALLAAKPRLLGAVYDAVAGMLANMGGPPPAGLPRMADFAVAAMAAERGLGETGEAFLAAYRDNQQGANLQALEESPLVKPLVTFMANRAEWRGAASDLLARLTEIGGHPDAKDWPKKPNQLTKKLRRLAPNIRRVTGIDVDCDARDATPERSRLVILSRPAGGAKSSSAPSDDWPTDPFSPEPMGKVLDGVRHDDRPAPSSHRPKSGHGFPVDWPRPDGADGADDTTPLSAAPSDDGHESPVLSAEATLRALRH